jgi:hypothetical protein
VTQSDFIGIDLTSSPKKSSACIGLDKELNLIFTGFLKTDADIAALVSSQPSSCLVAIDAPLTLPKGLCCLEESCSCQPESSRKGRGCERELARLGIPCYFTTKKSIIKPMVYRGIEIREGLERRGYQVIEVYPYASKARLWGRPIPKKTTSEGIAFLKDHIASFLPCLSPYIDRFNHDLCDALVAAYTAYLYHLGETEGIGDSEEGAIYIPGR